LYRMIQEVVAVAQRDTGAQTGCLFV
jgi:hypothetical protein